MGKRVELIGAKFGRLTVKRELSPRIRISENRIRRDRKFVCRCICGTEKVIFMTDLRSGDTISCGCYHKEISSQTALKTFTIHGQSYTCLYRVWADMKSRCKNPSHAEFHNYGRRGIKICKQWEKFEMFQNWAMANGYSKGLEIDRINNNSGYLPTNCRWVKRITNCNNQRKTIMLTWNNQKISLSDLCRELSLSRTRVYQRLKRDGMSLSEAINKPYRNYPKQSKIC